MRLLGDHDRLFRDSTLLLLTSVIGSGANFVFQAVMGRMLAGPDFAILWTMLGLMSIVSVPSSALQIVVTRYASRFRAREEPELVARLFGRACLRLTWYSVPVAVVCLAFASRIAGFFHIASSGPIVVTVLIFVVSLYALVVLGVVQGLERFGWYAAGGVISNVARLIAGSAFVFLGCHAAGALGGTLVGTSVLVLVLVVALRATLIPAALRSHALPLDSAEMYRFFWPVLVSMAISSAVLSLDLIVVKRVFDPDAAGVYSRAGTVARMVSYVTGPVMTAMFPKIVFQSTHGRPVATTFIKAILISAAVAVGMSSFCWFLPLDRLATVGNLVLEEAWRLYAFSAYPFRT